MRTVIVRQVFGDDRFNSFFQNSLATFFLISTSEGAGILISGVIFPALDQNGGGR